MILILSSIKIDFLVLVVGNWTINNSKWYYCSVFGSCNGSIGTLSKSSKKGQGFDNIQFYLREFSAFSLINLIVGSPS